MNNKKILITGGAGFIGSHLAEKLLKQGEEVFVVDDLSTGRLENIDHLRNNNNFHFTKGSVLDEDLIKELIAKVDQVYHLAAAVGVKKILKEPLDCLLTNVNGTEIVLKQAEKRKVKVLIASSSEVYGKGDKVPFKEQDDRIYGSVYNNRWIYAFSKGIDEFLGLAYFKEKKLPVIVTRFFNVIGPRQVGRYGMVVPTFIKQGLKGEPITVYGDGEQTRSFADVEDIVEALIKLMATKQAEGQVINLGADREISINNLAKKVIELTNSSSKITHIPYDQAYPDGFEDLRRRVPDISNIRRMIGYEPKFSLEETIKKIIKYQQQA
ncbi:MAG: SDR family NAD(P)-dependent oxidoreductase [Patescibacteria group bacterium]|nr:SDR family NAD(P)-dependent oxidoreductase [Patescibacteria group bacterium]